ncbi:NADP-dependent oxidoreductase [Humibacter sp. RRB41]|uniref:NADP-dependent oxidoreductase n=1 Tax=Humibacter sp. RRB41 TaxID=2919946 RepID=UPI001FAA3D45|nr:NADP-dependent oxidoreductase [Humibacter sp. RRB41]
MSTITSRVLCFYDYGEPLDVLRYEVAEVADPPADRVRVRVEATGLNPADWQICRGFMAGSLPRGVGCDVAGRVDAVGENVTDVAIGDLVVGSADYAGQPSAGAAEVAILRSWTPIPDGLDPVNAATLPMVVQTAVWTIDAMGVDSDTTLLVHGAGSMVGYAAVQVALDRGANVIATAGPALEADLTGFGAHVTRYGEGMVDRVRELATGPVDLVLDAAPPVTGIIPTLIETVRDPNDVVTVSNHDDARQLGARVNLDMLRINGWPAYDPTVQYAAKAAKGEFRLPIGRTFPLDDWRSAVELSLGRAPHGKIVLIP